ncbi:uncharacterized protein F5147DRAFT_267732 [Suillus discolor]|uniref:Uncharacterized protein n=1 Tax=Suillus discolor TaxID=1912936 RepID=A0A9P7F2G1_9AGAM|nr:uncharacterized protein F5147DRAFT_267732 [Suillus discolor]KAG2104404.1 hypothetical protein F5147DRAFT_267732 [Suillus discolor]
MFHLDRRTSHLFYDIIDAWAAFFYAIDNCMLVCSNTFPLMSVSLLVIPALSEPTDQGVGRTVNLRMLFQKSVPIVMHRKRTLGQRFIRIPKLCRHKSGYSWSTKCRASRLLGWFNFDPSSQKGTVTMYAARTAYNTPRSFPQYSAGPRR